MNRRSFLAGSVTAAGITAGAGGLVSAATGRTVNPAGASVKDSGAVGDGVADDAVAIQTAIDRGDPVVRLPAGTYKITVPLRLRSHLTLVGDGMASTVINQTGVDAHGLVGADLECVAVRDLMISGPKGTAASDGVHITNADAANIGMFYLSMSNVMIRRFTGSGLAVQDPVMCDLTNVTAKECGAAGFDLSGGGTSVTLTACYGHHNSNGFRLKSVYYCTFNGCGADNNTNGYKTEAAEAITFNACGAEANSANGWQITEGSGGVVLNNCWSDAPGSTPFKITGYSDGITLINPSQGGDKATAPYFIQVDKGCSNVAVLGVRAKGLATSYATGTTRVL